MSTYEELMNYVKYLDKRHAKLLRRLNLSFHLNVKESYAIIRTIRRVVSLKDRVLLVHEAVRNTAK